MTAPLKMPQADPVAEKALLGACLRDNGHIDEVAAIIQPSDFYVFAHGLIWSAILKLWRDQKKPDLVTLADYHNATTVDKKAKHFKPEQTNQVRESSQLEEIGGPPYLLDLWDGAPIVANAVEYAKIVRKKAMLREIYRLGSEMATAADHVAADVAEVLKIAQDGIHRIQSRQYGKGPVPMDDVIFEALQCLEKRQACHLAGGAFTEAIQTGWHTLDDLIVGFHKSELALIAARPSVGKTLVAGNIIANVAMRGDRKILFASLEQPNRELGIRWLSLLSGVSSWKTRNGQFSEEDKDRIFAASDIARGWRIWVDDQPAQTMSRILANARRIQNQHGLDLVVIDYLQIAEPEADGKRYDQVSQIARDAKHMARLLDLPVIALAQLNRETEKRNDRPKLSDLRESGWLEQEADTVILLHKPTPSDDSAEDIIEAIVAKQRNGPRGSVNLVHKKANFKVVDMTADVPWNAYK